MINFDDLDVKMLYSNIKKETLVDNYYDAIMKTIEKLERKGVEYFLSNEKLVYALVKVDNVKDDIMHYYCLAIKCSNITADFIINLCNKIEYSTYLFEQSNDDSVVVSVDSIVEISLANTSKFSFMRLNDYDIVLSNDDDLDNYNL